MAIQVRGLVKFPAQVVATGGISVTKANRVYTFTLDADLSGLSGLTTTGLVRRTGDGTFTAGNEVGASLSFSSGDVTIENGATNELGLRMLLLDISLMRQCFRLPMAELHLGPTHSSGRQCS